MRTSGPTRIWGLSLAALLCCFGCSGSSGGGKGPEAAASRQGFAEAPSAVRDGAQVRIAFTAGSATDCTVTIVGPDGKAVRHLAAGVLGADAPAPFAANSLHQELAWDGRGDKGQPVEMAGCRVRVGLGTRARFDRVIGRDRQWLGSIHALAAGDGRLYAFCGRGIVVLDREGKYLKQIVPAPAGLPLSRLGGLKPVKLPGGGVCFSREYDLPGKMQYVGSMALTAQGQLLLPTEGAYARRLARIETDGSVGAGAFDTRLTALSDVGYLHLAVDREGRTLYMAGAEAGYRGDDARKACYRQAVYRLRLDGKGPAEIFTGDDENKGGPGFGVNFPKGLAVDPEGRVYVCNYGGDNVAVYTSRGSLVKSFSVKHPQQIAVHPRTGQVYVLAGEELGYEKSGYDFEATMLEARLLRFSPDGTQERELKLPDPYVRKSSTRPGPSYQLRFAADFSEEVPVLWVGVADPSARLAEWRLLRVEDGAGQNFSEPREVCPLPAEALIEGPLQLTLDRERDVLYVHDACGKGQQDRLQRFSGDGKRLPPLILGKAGEQPYCFGEIAFGPDGNIYTLAWQGLWGGDRTSTLMRFARSGEPVPWPAGDDKERLLVRSLKGASGSSSRGLAVAPDGRVLVLYYDRARPEEGRQGWELNWNYGTALACFSPDGRLAEPRLVAYLRSGAQCVRVAPDGAIYVGDNTMPVGVAYPSELARALPDPLRREYPARLEDGSFDPLLRWMGSVIRFSPQGGKIVGLPEDDRTPAARRQRGDLWKPAPTVQWFMQNSQRVRMTGAEWQYHGFSPVPAQYQGVTHVERCVCKAGRFDLDEFGRVFVPDALCHRVTVLDAAGNTVVRFGSYGNADSEGPEIGLSDPWWVAAAADRVYIGEAQACRIVKVRLEQVASAECPIRN